MFYRRRSWDSGPPGGAGSLAVADLNGDGRPDIIASNAAGKTLWIALGRGDGTFSPPAAVVLSSGGSATAIAAADFNGDGKVDIAVVDNTSAVFSILAGNGDGTFQTQQVFPGGSQPTFVLAADVDRDGRIDLVTTNFFLSTVSVMRNTTGAATSSPLPSIILSTSQLQFSFTPGGPPPLPQVVLITSSGSGVLSWTAASSVPWLILASPPAAPSPLQTSGVTPSPLSVIANPVQMTAGVYRGAITVTGAGATAMQTISVTLTITGPGVGPGPGAAQPIVFSIRNSASYLPNIAQGSIFVVTGVNLGPPQLQSSTNPLPAQLGGTSVQLIAGGSNWVCPMVYTSASQIAAIIPSAAPVGQGSLSVTFAGQTSFPGVIQVVSSAVGIYSVRSSGSGPGVITGIDFGQKTPAQPAKPGDVVIAWATGLGPIDQDDSLLPTTFKQFANTEVFVGDRAARVVSASRSGCCSGLDQIAFEVPDGPQSCFVPVSIRTPGGSSNFITLPVSESGEPCSNPAPEFSQSLLDKAASGQALSLGLIGIGPVPVLRGAGFRFSGGFAERLSKILHVKLPDAEVDRLLKAYRTRNMAAVRRIVAKYAPGFKFSSASARKLLRAAAESESQQGAGATFGVASGIGAIAPDYASNFSAPGTCIVLNQNLVRDPAASIRTSDAGNTLTVDGPLGPTSMNRTAKGQYQAVLGTGTSPSSTVPGLYTVSGTGGADIGPFSISLNVTAPLTWTNKAAASTVDRTTNLTLTWSGGPATGHVLIGGGTQVSENTAVFICSEQTQKGLFTIPQFVLSALPEAQRGTLFIAPHPLDNPITIPGIDAAFIADAGSDSQTVTFR